MGFQTLTPENVQQKPRVNQQNLLPTATKNRHFGDIIQNGETLTQTTSLANGESWTFLITTTSSFNARNLSMPDMTLYQGSVAEANVIPGGASVTASNYQVVFMGNDLLLSDGFNTTTQVFVRNISAGTKTIILQYRERTLTPTAIEQII